MSNTSTSDSLLNEFMDIITNPLLSRDDRQTRSHTLLQQDDIPVNSIRNGRTPLTNCHTFFSTKYCDPIIESRGDRCKFTR